MKKERMDFDEKRCIMLLYQQHISYREGTCAMPNENKLKIAICDDQQTDLIRISKMTEQLLRDAGICHSISSYESAKALLADIQKGAQFHILLLDVLMGDMDGIELAAELKRQENKSSVIFASSNREMALRGYEVSAVRYLVKPLDAEKMREALIYCIGIWQEKKEILLPTGRGQYRISWSDIQFAEAFERGTRFILSNEIVESRLKFGEVEAMLPRSAFVHCHRAFIVNLACVKAIRPYEFELRSGQLVPIGKGRYTEVRKRFINYISD